MKKIIFLFCLTLGFLSSCITSKDINLLQDIPKNYPIEDAPADYTIIPGDQLRIVVYTLDDNMKSLFGNYIDNSALSQQGLNAGVSSDNNLSPNVVDVASDGTIKIPFVKTAILVEGRTILEAKELITSRLVGFSKEVTVDVFLNNRYFSVLGELGYSRITMDKQRMNIFQALALAGTGSDIGNKKKVYIIRQTGGGRSVYKSFDLRSRDIIDSEYYYIQPNDVIYMPKLGSTFFGRISNFWDIFATFASTVGIVTLIIKSSKKW